MLVAADVGYRLPTGRALFASVDLELAPGTALAIEGPSGTGKSTLLAILGGLLAPTSGHITAPANPNDYAWILQGLNGLPARNVLDNVRVCGLLDGDDHGEATDRARQVIDDLGLTGHIRTRAGLLSGGELQRVGIARALASTRPIVLADEPTSQLDRTNATRVMRKLVDAAADRIVVIVTHDHDAIPPDVTIARLAADGLHAIP